MTRNLAVLAVVLVILAYRRRSREVTARRDWWAARTEPTLTWVTPSTPGTFTWPVPVGEWSATGEQWGPS